VRREIIAIVETVAPSETLQREIGERSARLTDREPRMRAALEQHNVVPLYGEHPREQRTGES